MLSSSVLRIIIRRVLQLCAGHLGLAVAGPLAAPACSAYAGRLLRQQAIVTRAFWLLSFLLMAWVLFTAVAA